MALADGSVYYVQPMREVVADADRDLHVVYRGDAAVGGYETCAADAPLVDLAAPETEMLSQPTLKQAESRSTPTSSTSSRITAAWTRRSATSRR